MNEARPREICQALLNALEAAEGRRKRRKRDTSPDEIGLGIKRALLEAAMVADPQPEAFEAWLLERAQQAGPGNGAVAAMARSIFEEWQLAQSSGFFRDWLEHGAPSDDRGSG